ncbi:MAG: hypothetical protein KDB95_08660 [Flavobacteriales bacterium]|nr:hypothetical protein [Flavobacteriales bacterium]MCB9165758.1 hypothetical protein [Flavobacteriales bacterium]
MTRTLGPLAILLSVTGCRKTETVPTYLVVPRIDVQATDEQGGNTSKITEAWVTVDDRSVGVWELPARVPVIGTGTHTIGITAGIRRNGSFDDRQRYPYYTSWQTTTELDPAHAIELAPTVQYQPATFFTERFNDAGSQLLAASSSDTTLILYSASTNPEVLLDGSQCGGFVLDTSHDEVLLQTEQDFPGVSGPAYLELDYSTDVELTLGISYVLDGQTTLEPWVVIVANASAGSVVWNKIYVDLSDFFNRAGISGRDIYIAAYLPSGRSRAAAYFDNLKIIRPAS